MNQKRFSESTNCSRIPMSIFNHLEQPALVLDCAGRVVVWNNGMEQYTGVSAEEIVGRDGFAHGQALFGEKRPTLADCVLARDEPGSGDYRLLPHEGEGMLAESRIPLASGRAVVCMAAPLHDEAGRLAGVLETFRDASAETDPGIPEEQVRILAASLPGMIFTLDGDGIFTRFFRTGAPDTEEVVGRSARALFPADEAEFLVGAAQRAIAGGEVITETRSLTWGGDRRPFQIIIHPLHDSAGKIASAAGVCRDISGDLLRDRALQETGRKAGLYLDLLGTDIYNTSMVAATVIEMLRERLSGEEAELAQRVKNTVEQGITVIKNVELLNALDEHRIRLEPVDLNRIVESQIRRYAGIDIRYEPESRMVWASPLLEDVVSNLISNSVKFGGMKVRVEISVTETADTVTMTIADNGIGIPDHLKPNIFDRFDRGNKTASASGSRGLGLHIVKTLVARYGGRVWAADRIPGRPGEGAAIKVILQKC
ncbi:PAS domain-containing protein [Methanoculleus sp. Wushi-C6]|uniref:histidine kinase n=2 Tax=Methanoculleus caldifontis TaxID=2651577 RepID=A0ABU3X3T4_9EURY|nr:PAS domain-containing protein [Methanoculleus sp. Wushi-C6]